MISHDAFPVEPWSVRETSLQLDSLAQTESIFALANGHIGWRANLDEGEPYGLPGSYLNGVYEDRPLPWAEGGYGYPESGETMINVTNGKLVRLLVDDEPFDVRYGALRSHERVLDLRTGVLERRVEWVSPAGTTVWVTSRRLVSFTQRAIAALEYRVEPLDRPARIVVQSELVANEPLPALSGDPRLPADLTAPLEPEENGSRSARAYLMHRTRSSKLRVAVGMDHEADCPASVQRAGESRPDLARVTFTTMLDPGQQFCLRKTVAFGWSGRRSRSAMRDQVEGALATATATGWEGLLAEQRDYLDGFWRHADVALEGDDAIQQAIRFALFHVLQAGARAEGQPIPAKGLTGTGYDGHAFWDTETFVLPVLTYTLPHAAAMALVWRHTTLGTAQARAKELGLAGASFPWRTIAGRECSGYWPAGTAAFHLNADIADAVIRYTSATQDEEFAAGHGLELLVQTARLWCALGHEDGSGQFRIDGVTGPDEYSALGDNNVYTNLMAQQNLRAAAQAAASYPDRAARLGVNEGERAEWLAAAGAMMIPYDTELGVHPQAEGFTRHAEWDFAAMTSEDYPLMLHHTYFDLYRKQVVKQADLVLAMQKRPAAFTADQKARNFAYYERLTVRDSSLSACTQSVMAAEVGHLGLAYEYLAESALLDLEDLRNDTRNGLHIAALAGSWLALVEGLGGMRHCDGVIRFAPRLPPELSRLAFTLMFGGRELHVEVTADSATYLLAGDGGPLTIRHHGSEVALAPGQRQKQPIPPLTARPALAQPPGREPAVRRRQAAAE